ncbi:MAG: succinate dehydrogenase cytochrome b subunit [Acidobacteriota bacterium]
MAWLLDVYRSAIFKKAVMAVSGLMLFGFVLTHMLGNLKLYFGPEEINNYAEWLRTIGKPALPKNGALNIARVGLLAAVFLHIWSAWQVTRLSRKARPQKYVKQATIQATYASRTMRWGGVIVLLFIVYHLLHLTLGVVGPEGFEYGDVYNNVVLGFRNPLISGFYILANLALGLHLYHGLWSLFQSLGLNHPSYRALRRPIALAFASVVTLGNISFPLAVLSGVVG